MNPKEKGEMIRKILVLFLLLPLIVSCGGWTQKCTKRTSYTLDEEKTVSVGSAMVQDGCFGIRWEPYGPKKSVFGAKAYNDDYYEPVVERELLYSGRNGDILHITYREYSVSGHARTPFFQQVYYDLKSSDKIVFQNWVIQVLDANNQMIRFKVIKEPVFDEWYFY